MGWWTLRRASAVGFTAALVGLCLWPFYRAYGAPLDAPLLIAAGIAGLCGVSILAITGLDLFFHPRRGERVRPLRIFDLCLAAALIGLAFLQLGDIRAGGY
ncbi:MAG TPA: hypothetical protein VHM92_14025 [Allosphingosinicella sp.]|nr:hypothetical protein [Allosphingosinicella sp.]